MIQTLASLLSLAAGLALGWWLGRKSAPGGAQSEAEASRLRAELDATAARERAGLERAAGAEAEAKALREQLGARERDLNRQLEALRTEFSALAAKTLDEKSAKLREESERGLNSLLEPLKQNLTELRSRSEAIHKAEVEQRAQLEGRLAEMLRSSAKLSGEAENLTRALKGEVKAQGQWGEVQLETLLEQAGLRPGQEYFRQGVGLNLKFEGGAAAMPDVVVLLPGNRHLIVDSKVSLEAYVRATQASDAEARATAAKELAVSLRKHAKGLSEKGYHKLEGLRAPGAVIMFLPLEGALSLAAEVDTALIKESLDKEVVLATPTTLFGMMRAVGMIWTQERQNKSVLELAERAGLLYDKFTDFYGDMQALGTSLKRAQESFDGAADKLGRSRGNLVKQAEDLIKLGAKAKKALPPGAVDKAEANHEAALLEAGEN